jgi:hypothetical protein
MKELTTEWVYSKKRADCGGYDMLSKTEDDARAFITRNTNMTTSESEVTTIKFTCDKEDDGVLFLPIENFDYGIDLECFRNRIVEWWFERYLQIG